jgi:hypothetical protein|tara:strand:- start:659 stop:793 length:135 start_codon:yes stop_codon:yes gene_type:complete
MVKQKSFKIMKRNREKGKCSKRKKEIEGRSLKKLKQKVLQQLEK